MLKIFSRFYSFILKYRANFVGYLLLQIISVSLNFANPYFYKLLVDNIVQNQIELAITIFVIFVVVRFASLFIGVAASYLSDHVVIPAARDVRIKAFCFIQDLDFAFHANKNTGALISAFKRGDAAFYSIFDEINTYLLEVLIGFSITFFFFSRVDLTISVMLVGILILNAVASWSLIKSNLEKRNTFNESEDEVSGVITDNLINYETVKYFAQEKQEETRLKEKFKIWLDNFYAFCHSFRIIDLVIGGISNVGIFAILFVTTRKLLIGQTSVGDFVMVTGFLASFFPVFSKLIYRIRGIAKYFVDIEKYFAILDQEVLVTDPASPVSSKKIKGNIEFKNVSFSYRDGKKNVLKGVNLQIRQGESVALVGKSGVGKTTLIRLLLRFYDVSQGQLLIDGINVTKFRKQDLRGLIGIVPQEPILFNNTVGFNIAYGKPAASCQEISRAVKMANLYDFVEKLPDKYETQVGERGIKLSGGQKQRLAIARVILADPKIIIFDEATSNLDSESERLIQNSLWKIAHNRTLIIIAHRFSTIRKVGRVIVFDKGQIVDEGTHQDLIKNDKSLYRYLWNLQVKGEIE